MKILMRTIAASCAAAAFCALAQEGDFDFGSQNEQAAAAANAEGEASPDAEAAGGEEAGRSASAHVFKTLPYCRSIVGAAEVLKPGASEWEPLEEGKFYPLGSTYRTTDPTSRLKVQFGETEDISVQIEGGPSSFGTRFQPFGEDTRTVTLKSGVVAVKLPRNMPDGKFKVVSPFFEVVNPKGVSRYAYKQTVDGEVAQIRCITGSFGINGRNFTFPEVKTACEVKIRSSQDQLFTGLYGNRGDSNVILDQGSMLTIKNFETGEVASEKKTLSWVLSPKTAVRIHRAVPAIGEGMSVSVMTFDASGALRNRCAFAEGVGEINTGELGPVAQEEKKDDAAKKNAAAASDVMDVEVEIEDDAIENEVGGATSEPVGVSTDTAGDAKAATPAAGDDFEF